MSDQSDAVVALDDGAPFRGWLETPLGEAGGTLYFRITEGRLRAVIFPVLLVPGGEGSRYRWEAAGLAGEAGDLLTAKSRAHEAMSGRIQDGSPQDQTIVLDAARRYLDEDGGIKFYGSRRLVHVATGSPAEVVRKIELAGATAETLGDLSREARGKR